LAIDIHEGMNNNTTGLSAGGIFNYSYPIHQQPEQ
jgi:hypothetical protein